MLIAASAMAWGQVAVTSAGIVQTGLPAANDNLRYQTYVRQYANIQWQWVIDHGYRFVAPRAGSMLSQFFRALEGHSERFPGLYNNVSTLVRSSADPCASPAIDNREAGSTLWEVALGAKKDADPA